MPLSYNNWRHLKPRVRKKYTLLLSRYLSPKELTAWIKSRNLRGYVRRFNNGK